MTASTLYTYISLVQSELKKSTSLENCDSVLYFMATEMKVKYDKYWGLIETMNPIIFIANALDPRFKLAYIAWSCEEIYGETIVESMVNKVKASLARMYEWYAHEYGNPIASGNEKDTLGGDGASQMGPYIESHAQKAWTAAFRSHLKKKDTIEAKNELERYLQEPCECVEEGEEAEKHFDVLTWWKSMASRFEVLSKMERDVLVVPVSTVASESAFSTGGRVLDVFRSSLNPKTAEELICTQNWLKPSKIDIHDFEFGDDDQAYA